MLGEMNYEGWNVYQDYTKAIGRYTKAADQGISAAQSKLGLVNSDGKAVSQNMATAKGLLSNACDNDCPTASHRCISMEPV